MALTLALGACTEAIEPNSAGPERQGSPTSRRDGRRSRGWFEAACDLPVKWLERIERGHYVGRGPEISFVPYEGNPFGAFPVATTHSGPWDFLQEVPLVFRGPGFIRRQGEIRAKREVTIADVAPTLAHLLGLRVPEGTEGRPITRVLVPRKKRSDDLRLIVVVVWDGGGRNVLEHWRGRWPYLESLMEQGTSVVGATVGSSPSVTPAVHASLGTGRFPHSHGIVNILQREGGRIVPGVGPTPERLEAPTLADIYDRSTRNQAKVGIVAKDSLHFPMAGHGSAFPGGDVDVGILFGKEAGDEVVGTMAPWFRAPFPFGGLGSRMQSAARTLDMEDGKRDGAWMGHELPADPFLERGFNKAPVWTALQTRISKTVITKGDFGRDSLTDLFFTNYKDPDYVGHAFNFHSQEVGRTIAYADTALKHLTRWLDRRVGRQKWIVVVTADHGQSPLPETAGTWPIDAGQLVADITAFAEAKPESLVQHIKQNGAWIDADVLRARDKSLADIARFLMSYRIRDNAGGDDYPDAYSDRLGEPVFEAAFPTTSLPRLIDCARRS
jgi:hypothetical protein